MQFKLRVGQVKIPLNIFNEIINSPNNNFDTPKVKEEKYIKKNQIQTKMQNKANNAGDLTSNPNIKSES